MFRIFYSDKTVNTKQFQNVNTSAPSCALNVVAQRHQLVDFWLNNPKVILLMGSSIKKSSKERTR